MATQDKHLEDGKYLCTRVNDVTQMHDRIDVANDKIYCDHVLGAECSHPSYRLDTCLVWLEAFQKYNARLKINARIKAFEKAAQNQPSPNLAEKERTKIRESQLGLKIRK